MISAEELYSYTPYARWLTGDEQEAKDLLHDVYIKLHNCNYEERGKLSAMIRAVILNRFRDICRRKKKYGYYFSLDKYPGQDFQPDFENSDITDRQKAIIARYLYNLSDRDKKIWELYTDRFSQKQMVALMGMNINAVSAVVFRIKQKLLKTING